MNYTSLQCRQAFEQSVIEARQQIPVILERLTTFLYKEAKAGNTDFLFREHDNFQQFHQDLMSDGMFRLIIDGILDRLKIEYQFKIIIDPNKRYDYRIINIRI